VGPRAGLDDVEKRLYFYVSKLYSERVGRVIEKYIHNSGRKISRKEIIKIT
jgi:hypothetical protein